MFTTRTQMTHIILTYILQRICTEVAMLSIIRELLVETATNFLNTCQVQFSDKMESW